MKEMTEASAFKLVGLLLAMALMLTDQWQLLLLITQDAYVLNIKAWLNPKLLLAMPCKQLKNVPYNIEDK